MIESLNTENLMTFFGFLVVGGAAVVAVVRYLVQEKNSLIETIRTEKEYSRDTEKAIREIHITSLEVHKDVVVAIDKNTKAVETVAELVRSCGVGRG